MKFHHLLRLSGYGYLRCITQREKKMVAQIKTVTHFNPSNQGNDEIWLDCEVTNLEHIIYLSALKNSVLTGDKVMITFEADCNTFINAYSGQEGDPNNIITLEGKLLTIDSWYINGCLVEQGKVSLRALG